MCLQTAWEDADSCQEAVKAAQLEAQEAGAKVMHAEARVMHVQGVQSFVPSGTAKLGKAKSVRYQDESCSSALYLTEAVTADSRLDMALLLSSWKEQQGKSRQAAETFKHRAQQASTQAQEANLRASIAGEQARELRERKLVVQAAAADAAAAGFARQCQSFGAAAAAAHTDAESATAAAQDAELHLNELEAASAAIDHRAVRQVLQGAREKMQEAAKRGAQAWQSANVLKMEVRGAA